MTSDLTSRFLAAVEDEKAPSVVTTLTAGQVRRSSVAVAPPWRSTRSAGNPRFGAGRARRPIRTSTDRRRSVLNYALTLEHLEATFYREALDDVRDRRLR